LIAVYVPTSLGHDFFRSVLNDATLFARDQQPVILCGDLNAIHAPELVQGRDFDDTFAPVAAFSSILFMLKFALNENYLVHHADFDAAFLNTPISHELFMKQIPGFEEGDHSMV